MPLPILFNPKTPPSLAYKVYRAEQVRQHEPAAARLCNLSLFTLMQRAGIAASRYLQRYYPVAHNIVVVVGWGNNGGDGYILACEAQKQGLNVSVVCADPKRELSGDALRAQQLWLDAGNPLLHWQNADFSAADVVVDALLGNGLSGEIRAPMQQLIACLNDCSAPILSLDLPSGLHADTGQAMPVAVKAHSTITFVAIKPGLVTGQGKTYCGQLALDDLGIAQAFAQCANAQAELIAWQALPALLARQEHANKGHFGRLLCIGGNVGMGGAIRLSAEAALRCGTGLVKVFCHEQSRWQVSHGRPEIMLNHDSGIQALKAALDWCSHVVMGPGLGTDSWAQSLVKQVLAYLKRNPKFALIDADGLNILAQSHDSKGMLKQCVLTPHPGEAARLLNTTVSEIERDRYQACQQIAQQYAAVVVLKGAGTLVASHAAHTLQVCADGNPGMATAGMGDVLSGVIAGLAAQGLDAPSAADYGVCLHAAAGDRVASLYGQRGMMASDLFEPLRTLVNYR